MDTLPIALLLSLVRQLDGTPQPYVREPIAPAVVLFSCQTTEGGELSVSEHDGVVYYQMRHQDKMVAFGTPATHRTYSQYPQADTVMHRLSLEPHGERAEWYEIVSVTHPHKSAERFVQVVDGKTVKDTQHCQETNAQDALSSLSSLSSFSS